MGFAFLIIGLFITAPIAMIAATYAYEDIIGPAGAAAQPASAGFGPSGTVVMPGAPPKQASPALGGWKPDRPTILVGAFTIAIALIFLSIMIGKHRSSVRQEREYEACALRNPPPPIPLTIPKHTESTRDAQRPPGRGVGDHGQQREKRRDLSGCQGRRQGG